MSKMKKLFATPKKAVLTIACVGTALALLGGTTAYAAKAIAVSGAIGSNNAFNFAAADAGVDPASVLLENAEFGFEMGQFVYEVEFNADGMEYDYLIKSSDGTVLKKEAKVEKDNKKASKPDSKKPDSKKPVAEKPTAQKPVEEKTLADKPVKQQNNAPVKAVSLEEAKNKALADAGMTASAVKFTKQKADYDDGVKVYEIEFIADGVEYEYEINAATGAIRDKSVEVIGGQNNRPVATKKPIVVEITTKKAQPVQPTEKVNTVNAISLEEAKNKALADAGVAASAVKFTKQNTEYDDGVKIYDIEFFTATHEYEYEINVATGAVRDKSVEAIGRPINPPVATTKAAAVEQTTKKIQPVDNNTGKAISEQEAKNKALADAGVAAADVKFITARVDYDDGVKIYDIEFRTETHEYEYEINAATGAVRDKSVERFVPVTKADSQQNNGAHIGVDRAKEIAAAKAGVSVNEVVFKKAKLERDDGIAVYEIEFVKDRNEYDFTIHAVTGAILESDVERVDWD